MKKSFAIFFLCFVASPLLAQDRGTIDCMGLTQVPTLTAPGSANVVDYLACGQMVSITGLERGYVRIQVGERISYVDAKYVRLLQGTMQPQIQQPVFQQPQTPPPTPPPAIPPPAIPPPATAPPPTVPAPRQSPEQPPAQAETGSRSYPKAELFGGYNYVHLGGGAGWMDGWNASIVGNLHPVVGLKAELSGLYARDTGLSSLHYSAYGFMGGLQLSGRGRSVTGFGHALFGVGHFGASVPLFGTRVGASVNGFTAAIGGGIDWHGRRRIAWRVVQIDYVPFRAMGEMVSNFRLSSGIVARFR